MCIPSPSPSPKLYQHRMSEKNTTSNNTFIRFAIYSSSFRFGCCCCYRFSLFVLFSLPFSFRLALTHSVYLLASVYSHCSNFLPSKIVYLRLAIRPVFAIKTICLIATDYNGYVNSHLEMH